MVRHSQNRRGSSWSLLALFLSTLTIDAWISTFPSPSRGYRSVALNAATEQFQDILTDEAVDDIATEAALRIALRFRFPQSVVKFSTKKAVEAIASKLSPSLVQEIGEVVVTYDDADKLEPVAKAMATELDAQLDVPFMKEEEQEEMFYQISKSVLKVLASTKKKNAVKGLVDQSVKKTCTLLCPEGRESLTKKLNEKIDFPFLTEDAEEKLFSKALEACSDQLQQLLPDEYIALLRGQGPEGLEETKQFIVEKINRDIDLPGLSEEQEEWLFQNVVEVLLGDTEAELQLMTPEEQKETYLERRAVLQRDMDLNQKRFERKRAEYEAQIAQIDVLLQNIGQEA